MTGGEVRWDDAVGSLDSPSPNPDKAPRRTKSLAKEISMSLASLEATVNTAFDAREGISTATRGEVREAGDHALDLLDKGEARVATRETGGKGKVNQWLKKAVLLSFILIDKRGISGCHSILSWCEQVPSLYSQL